MTGGGTQRCQVGGQGRDEDGTQDEREASDVNQPWDWTLCMIYCKYLYFVSEIHHLEHKSYTSSSRFHYRQTLSELRL